MVLGSDLAIRATFRGKVTLCHKMRGFGNPLRAKPREILETQKRVNLTLRDSEPSRESVEPSREQLGKPPGTVDFRSKVQCTGNV